MATLIAVDDPADPRLAEYVGLTDADLRRRVETGDETGDGTSGDGTGRGGHGLFVAEGVLAVRRLLSSRYPLRSVLVAEPRLPSLAGDIAGVDGPVYVAPQAVMDAVAGFHIHRGVLAAGSRLPPIPVAEVIAATAAVAVIEDVNDHENLGAIFRNAAALGVGAVLLSPRCCDPLYRRSVRVSVGHVLTVPFTTVEPWPDGLAELRAAGFRVLALTPGDGAVTIDDVASAPHSTGRVAVMVGAEGPGLSPAALAAADTRVRIPMAAGGDSLNVATAAAIAFHRLVPVGGRGGA